MDPIIWEREPPELRSPVLVASFSGWNDAASAAGTALGAIGASLETELVARIDPEEFFDFQANRPTIEISGGTMQNVEWPTKVTTATAPFSPGGRRGGASTRAGHGVRGSSSMRGTAEKGCPAAPVRLMNRCPSK